MNLPTTTAIITKVGCGIPADCSRGIFEIKNYLIFNSLRHTKDFFYSVVFEKMMKKVNR